MRVDVGGYAYIIRRLPIVTNYEQKQEQKAERKYMIMQKSIGLLFTIICILPVVVYKEPRILLLTGVFALLGLAITFTKEHVISI